MKKIKFMDVSFRDGFQSCYGARVKTDDFLPVLEAAKAAGIDNFEIGGGARFQSLYFYCQEDAFDMMDRARQVVGPDINLQTLARGANVVGLVSQSRDIIDLHARMFRKHGITTIRNFDALMDIRNLAYSGQCIHNAGLKHQVVIALMGLPPGLNEKYCHTPQFYLDKLKEILDAGIPYDSVAFKDASGTTPPTIVYEAIKGARKMLPEGTIIEFHTHDTAGMGVACNFAAIEAGADIIDLAMAPVSGGTAEVDILTMWHRLRGTDYTLDIDPEKILEVESMFIDHMDKYYMPPEAKEVNPVIPFSPMPGGALTANTQMMRDNNSLHLFPEVIRNMREVVAKGGFGSSVTPVSQFYFQQAFANTVQGKWAKITESYGKMVLGYFGKTPAEPDPEIVKLASEQLGLEPTTEDVHDINDRNPELGIAYNRSLLEKEGLATTEENIFIAATCGAKGIAFLKGEAPLGIRYKADVEAEAAKKAAPKAEKAAPAASRAPSSGNYMVTVDGRAYNVTVAEGTGAVQSVAPAAAVPAQVAADSGDGKPIEAAMPGSVVAVEVEVGDTVSEGDTVLIIEAMKMESPVKSTASGKVISIEVAAGDTVASGDVLMYIG
ncbi:MULTISPECIES: biotin/lipoyl-containing protein [Prosthecochloris]|uniref:Biotin attachment protein n=1 Tax=Prosthecochloris vibrioformis TaxID=1098 RepID=A0A5C4RYJ7_PROVB|nr:MULTISPECIES: biotin/lipoyl-containing protein [Prosthecochloris]ANT64789.1 2-oxoglutarate carboxylase large subunit [Prosthecochloris sp. CIB 2401]TNJ36102.1 biotin attachment protein [Prosthecochloris vibrioformis]